MSNRMLTVILFVLGFVLVFVLFVSDRSISRVFESIGTFIADTLGF